MKNFFATVMSAGAIVFVLMALTMMLFNPFGASAQWTPMHQMAHDITNSYTKIVPKARVVEPIRTPRPVPVVQPILPRQNNVTEVITLDQYGNLQSSQIIINGSSIFSPQTRDRRPAGGVRAPR